MIYTSVSYIKKAHKVSKETVSICTKRDENSSIFLKKTKDLGSLNFLWMEK